MKKKKNYKYQVYQAGGDPRRPVFVQSDTFATNAHEDAQMSNKFTEMGQMDNSLPDPKKSPYVGPYDFHPLVKLFNALAQTTTGIANRVTDAKNTRDEWEQYMRSIQTPKYESFSEQGLNPNPAYFQTGGSIVDYMSSKGMGSSFAARKKMFDPYFGGNYSGTAEQNIQMLKQLQSGVRNSHRRGEATPVQAAAPAKAQNKLDSGVIVDKRKNEAYVIKGGKKVKSFPVLTGKNPDRNSNAYNMDQLDQNPALRNTPAGSYMLKPGDYYGAPGFGLNPIQAFGNYAPTASDLAMHVTYDPANRNKYYAMGSKDRAQSYGCINCQKPDLDYVRQSFPKGDTLQVIDSQMPQYKNMMNNYAAGGNVSAAKAREILHDGTVHGHPLTEKQRRYFGMMAHGKAQFGDENDMNDTRAVEAEEGEVYQRPDGELQKVPEGAGTHEEGGVIVTDAERILEDTSDKRSDPASKALKLDPALVSLLTGYDTKQSMTHSKAMEHARANIAKKVGKVEKHIEKNTESLKANINDKFANNSLKFNMTNLNSTPTEGEIFDTLFQHQEMLKGALGIENPKAQYGGKYTAQFGTYAGGKTKKGATTPTGLPNAFSFEGGLDAYKKAWAPILDLSQYKNAKDAQGATYDYLLNNAPDVLKGMWKTYGNTAQGLNSNILTDKYKNGDFSSADLSTEDLKSLRNAYVDNMLGIRTLVPGKEPEPAPAPTPEAVTPEPTPEVTPTPSRGLSTVKNPKSRFYEPLRWFDVAGPIGQLLEGRIPAKYNPVEFNQVRLKLQNPQPALQQGQREYNAALQTLPANGQGFANAANMFSKKYSLDNQVLGQYENANAQIKNQETLYNANVRDRQSMADQQARGTFEQQYLMSKEAQRQQHATALDELYTRLAQNRKLNREGNLLMQLYPAFDQYAEYNGYNIPLRMPLNTPNTPTNVPLPAPAKAAPQKAAGQRFISLSNGKKIYF